MAVCFGINSRQQEVCGYPMETVTLVATIAYSSPGGSGKCDRLWIGQHEVAAEDRSIATCLAEMQREGWNLISASACPSQDGTTCTYKFNRAYEK